MEWWYKSAKYKVTPETIMQLQDAVKTAVSESNNLSMVNLYKDGTFFYIQTGNRISLNHFLFQHSFKEMDDEPVKNIELLFGRK